MTPAPANIPLHPLGREVCWEHIAALELVEEEPVMDPEGQLLLCQVDRAPLTAPSNVAGLTVAPPEALARHTRHLRLHGFLQMHRTQRDQSLDDIDHQFH